MNRQGGREGAWIDGRGRASGLLGVGRGQRSGHVRETRWRQLRVRSALSRRPIRQAFRGAHLTGGAAATEQPERDERRERRSSRKQPVTSAAGRDRQAHEPSRLKTRASMDSREDSEIARAGRERPHHPWCGYSQVCAQQIVRTSARANGARHILWSRGVVFRATGVLAAARKWRPLVISSPPAETTSPESPGATNRHYEAASGAGAYTGRPWDGQDLDHRQHRWCNRGSISGRR